MKRIILFLLLVAAACSDDEPKKLYVSKVTDASGFGFTTNVSYDGAEITSIETYRNSDGSQILDIQFTHLSDSTIAEIGEPGSLVQRVYKFENELLTSSYFVDVDNQNSVYNPSYFHYNSDNELTKATYVMSDNSVSDSTIVNYLWDNGNISEFTAQYFKDGVVVSEYTRQCEYDSKKNFSNGSIYHSYVIGLEGEVFTLCSNNLVGIHQTDNTFDICCYNYKYNGSGYPSEIQGVQNQVLIVDYKQ
jgi:hypothetical protein